MITKPILGAAALVVLSGLPVQAQEPAPCDPATASLSELVVWRGSDPTVAEVPTVRPDPACVEPEAVSEALVVSEAGLIEGDALSWPDLTEIEVLVLSAPEVKRLHSSSGGASSATDIPEVLERFPTTAARRHPLRAVIRDPSMGDGAAEMIHLIVLEASPSRLDVAVQPLNGPEVTLRWRRSVQSPEWVAVPDAAS